MKITTPDNTTLDYNSMRHCLSNDDLQTIEELEQKIGSELPIRRTSGKSPKSIGEEDSLLYNTMTNDHGIGAFINSKGEVVGFIFSPYSGNKNTKITLRKIPLALFKLKHLRKISFGFNAITDIPAEITSLPHLRILQLIGNRITTIEPFLLDLQLKIGLSNDIAHSKRGETMHRYSIILEGNPISSPPLEIVEQGNKAIRNYFAQIEKEKGQTQYLFEAKLLIIGEGGTGKTSFRRKIVNPTAELPKDKDTTLGVDVDKWDYTTPVVQTNTGDALFHINLWDFGGQKIYRGTHQIFFSDKSFYVLVADTREQKTDFSYWLNTVHQLAGDGSGVLILLNKKHGHIIKFDEKGYRGHFGKIIKEVVELDLGNDIGKIIDLQDIVKRHLKELPGIGDPLPPSWVKIREALLEKTEHFISFDTFRDICAEHAITDPSVIRTLSGYFNRIGAFTHYIDDPVLQERIYLDANWLVNTVYEVLDNKQVKEKNGRISEEEICTIWKANELSFEINKLSQLMHNFGLMYHIPDSKDYVVPEHLPTDQPYVDWEHDNSPYILYFKYEFDKYMPQGLMSRLIVSLHRHIDNHEHVWHRGVNVDLKDTHAEVIESYGSENSFQIRIVGTHKIELLAIIREKFAEVLDPFKSLNYKQLVPCTCDECEIAPIPAFHEYDNLLNLRQKEKGSQCPKSGEVINVSDLLRITEFVPEGGNCTDPEDDNPIDSTDLKKIELFLASSSELKADRERVEIWVNRENKKLVDKGVFLHLHMWEDFLDAMSKTRLQDEYNKVTIECDIFICLLKTKVGKYTEEEFEAAYASFKDTGQPKYIYTYFKEFSSTECTLDDLISIKSFQKKLGDLGHYYTPYKSREDLTGQLKNQLEKIMEDMELV